MTKSFMHGDKTPETQRKQRQEEQIELRRIRTEELLKKKREIAIKMENSVYAESKRKLYNNESLDDIYAGAYEFRIVLSQENNPPVKEILETGILYRVVELLNPAYFHNYPANEIVINIRLECAWILTNICTGTHDQTRQVVETNACDYLVDMLNSNNDEMVDQAVWCLGNIAGDCEEFRDKLLNLNILPRVVDKIHYYGLAPQNIKITANLTWFLGNLNRGRNPPPTYENMLISSNIFEQMCISTDPEIVSTCFWGISYICDVDNGMTDQILNSTIMNRICELLNSLTSFLKNNCFDYDELSKLCVTAISPIIRTVGNIVSGSDSQTDAILNLGIIDTFPILFYKFHNKKLPRIRKEICWTISNITAGTPEQTRYIINKNMCPLLIDAISSYEIYIRKEAIYALVNISMLTTEDSTILDILVTHGIYDGLKKCIQACENYNDIIIQILDICINLLDVGESQIKLIGTNKVTEGMIECKLAETIENLQDIRNTEIATKAYNIIMKYFDGEDEDVYY